MGCRILLLPLLFCLCVLVGCKNSGKVYDRQTYDSFPESVHLKGKPVAFDDAVLLAYPRIAIRDSVLCIYDQDSGNRLFYIYTYPELKYRYSFVNKGRGPDEIPGGCEFDLTSGYLHVFNPVDKKEYLYDVKGGRDKPVQTRKCYDSEVFFMLRYCAINDSLFAATSYNPYSDYRVNIVDGEKKTIVDSLFLIPKVKDLSFVHNKSEVWDSFVAYNAEG